MEDMTALKLGEFCGTSRVSVYTQFSVYFYVFKHVKSASAQRAENQMGVVSLMDGPW